MMNDESGAPALILPTAHYLLFTVIPLPSSRMDKSAKRFSPPGATQTCNTGRQYMPRPAMPQPSMCPQIADMNALIDDAVRGPS